MEKEDFEKIAILIKYNMFNVNTKKYTLGEESFIIDLADHFKNNLDGIDLINFESMGKTGFLKKCGVKQWVKSSHQESWKNLR